MVSGILGLYVLRRENRYLALGIGIPPILLGLVFLLLCYGLVSAALAWAFAGSACFVFLWFVYESTGRERLSLAIFPIFIGWFTLLLMELYVFFFSPAILFIYVSIALAVTHSYDLSETEVQGNIQKLGKCTQVLVRPFSAIDSKVRTRIGGATTTRALFVSYILFELVLLLAVPAVLMFVFANALVFYFLNFVMTGVILLARWETGSRFSLFVHLCHCLRIIFQTSVFSGEVAFFSHYALGNIDWHPASRES